MTETIKHTPGPWTVEPTSMGTIEAADGRAVAQAFQVVPMRDDIKQLERQANARLIAAAPDLLAALQRAVTWCHEHDDIRHKWFRDGIDAIKRATGAA